MKTIYLGSNESVAIRYAKSYAKKTSTPEKKLFGGGGVALKWKFI